MKIMFTHSLLVLGSVLLSPMDTFAQSVDSTRSGTNAQDALSPRQILDRSLTQLSTLDDDRYSERKVVVYHELLGALKTSQTLVPAVPGILRENPHASNSLIHALEDVGTPVAQAALSTIAADAGFQHEDRLRAVMGLGAVEEPTPSSLASLWLVAAQRSEPKSIELSNTSLLAMGAAGSRLSTSAPLYRTLTQGLIRGLNQTSDSNLRAMTLKAIGNLHNPAFGSVVLPHLHDEEAPVRASAAHALGMLRDSSNRNFLVSLLPNEPRGAVRSAMVDAVRRLPASDFSLRSINDYIFVEPHAHARATMARYLIDHFYEFDGARGTLLQLFETDPSQQVRILASYATRH